MATNDALIEQLRTLVGAPAVTADLDFSRWITAEVMITLAQLRPALEACRDAGYFLETITGLDFVDTNELVYQVNRYEPRCRIALRLLCGKDQKVPTVSDIFSSALWQEREVWEFFGIRFTDHPDLKPLLLPEDTDFHPLQKDFGKVHAYRRRDEIYG